MSEPGRFGTPRSRPGAAAARAETASSERRAERGSPRELAHELNNLLDGSLRNLSLVLTALGDHGGEVADAGGEAVSEDTIRRLQTANESMQQMAELLRCWMAAEGRPDGEADDGAVPGQTLGEAVANARRQIEPLLAARGIALVVEGLTPELAEEPAAALQQVIHNALRNAVEAIDRHGRIELSCKRAGDQLVVKIRDDGPGPPVSMPWGEDGLPVPGATTKPGGHGMGLTISRRIVESMGGTLRLDTAPGGGAVLSLRCPAGSTGTERG